MPSKPSCNHTSCSPFSFRESFIWRTRWALRLRRLSFAACRSELQSKRYFGEKSLRVYWLDWYLPEVLFPVVLWRWQSADVALAVSVAVFSACSIASAVAMGLPWLLRTLGQDPAFAAGPLATVIQDLLSVLVYLVVCAVIV